MTKCQICERVNAKYEVVVHHFVEKLDPLKERPGTYCRIYVCDACLPFRKENEIVHKLKLPA